ncbi:MAG: M13 family peptidase, partial [Thermoanaerobaculia bacterium]
MKRILLLALLAIPAFAQTTLRPLTDLPYTPSLDVPSMDRTIDPCVDFYQFTCGGWLQNNPIPGDQAAWSVYGKLEEDNMQYLWGILEDAAKNTADRTPVQQKIGDYFASCMDTAAIEEQGTKPLQPLLDQIAALKTKRELADFLAAEHPRTYGGGWLFGFGSDQDFGDATQVIAEASAGGLSLPDRDYYVNNSAKSKELRAKYVQHVANMLQLLGESKAKSKTDAQAVLRIETVLAKASLTRVQRRDPYNLYHKMTRAELQKLTPSFGWKRYFADTGIGDVTNVNVTEPKFFKAVETEIQTVPLAQWKTYLRWHAVHARAPYLSSSFVAEDFNFY